MKRAASRAAKGFGFVPTAKAEGEIRTLILVADGSEEVSVGPFATLTEGSVN